VRIYVWLRQFFVIAILTTCIVAEASEHHGQVTFGGLPLPGATVTATQGDRKFVAVTDQQGQYSFPDLTDGAWTIEVEMQCFEPLKQNLTVGPGAQPSASIW